MQWISVTYNSEEVIRFFWRSVYMYWQKQSTYRVDVREAIVVVLGVPENVHDARHSMHRLKEHYILAHHFPVCKGVIKWKIVKVLGAKKKVVTLLTVDNFRRFTGETKIPVPHSSGIIFLLRFAKQFQLMW